jgi:hypothetical protein
VSYFKGDDVIMNDQIKISDYQKTMEAIETILWYQCNKEQITNNVPYEYIPWYYLLIIMMNYDVDINTLLSEYQYYNPLC